MFQQLDWYSCIRAVLELLYFASGIAIAIAAFFGLRQVKIASEQLKFSREIASTSSKREAAKLAADQCRYFAEECVPAFKALVDKYKAQNLTFLQSRLKANEPQFVIQSGEFVSVNCDTGLVQREFPKVEIEILKHLNGLEYFAILFAAGIADEDIGYRETALAFCEGLDYSMAAVHHLRSKNRGRFDSTVKLFEIWKRRTTARAVAPFMTSMQALIKQAESDKIKILGECV